MLSLLNGGEGSGLKGSVEGGHSDHIAAQSDHCHPARAGSNWYRKLTGCSPGQPDGQLVGFLRSVPCRRGDKQSADHQYEEEDRLITRSCQLSTQGLWKKLSVSLPASVF